MLGVQQKLLNLIPYQKGENHPNYGKKLTEEQKKRISETSKGRRLSDSAKAKISEKIKGNKHTESAIQKMKEARKDVARMLTELNARRQEAEMNAIERKINQSQEN